MFLHLRNIQTDSDLKISDDQLGGQTVSHTPSATSHSDIYHLSILLIGNYL